MFKTNPAIETSLQSTAGVSTQDDLYSTLRSLALEHASPGSIEHILSIRAHNATHSWGHTGQLVRKNPGLADIMDNTAFTAHLLSTGRYVTSPQPPIVQNIIVDVQQRRAVVRMTYFLCVEGGNVKNDDDEKREVVEQDLIWMLRFTSGDGPVLIEESVEFIDAAASARLGTLVRAAHGEVGEDVRGGITLQESN